MTLLGKLDKTERTIFKPSIASRSIASSYKFKRSIRDSISGGIGIAAG